MKWLLPKHKKRQVRQPERLNPEGMQVTPCPKTAQICLVSNPASA